MASTRASFSGPSTPAFFEAEEVFESTTTPFEEFCNSLGIPEGATEIRAAAKHAFEKITREAEEKAHQDVTQRIDSAYRKGIDAGKKQVPTLTEAEVDSYIAQGYEKGKEEGRKEGIASLRSRVTHLYDARYQEGYEQGKREAESSSKREKRPTLTDSEVMTEAFEEPKPKVSHTVHRDISTSPVPFSEETDKSPVVEDDFLSATSSPEPAAFVSLSDDLPEEPAPIHVEVKKPAATRDARTLVDTPTAAETLREEAPADISDDPIVVDEPLTSQGAIPAFTATVSRVKDAVSRSFSVPEAEATIKSDTDMPLISDDEVFGSPSESSSDDRAEISGSISPAPSIDLDESSDIDETGDVETDESPTTVADYPLEGRVQPEIQLTPRLRRPFLHMMALEGKVYWIRSTSKNNNQETVKHSYDSEKMKRITSCVQRAIISNPDLHKTLKDAQRITIPVHSDSIETASEIRFKDKTGKEKTLEDPHKLQLTGNNGTSFDYLSDLKEAVTNGSMAPRIHPDIIASGAQRSVYLEAFEETRTAKQELFYSLITTPNKPLAKESFEFYFNELLQTHPAGIIDINSDQFNAQSPFAIGVKEVKFNNETRKIALVYKDGKLFVYDPKGSQAISYDGATHEWQTAYEDLKPFLDAKFPHKDPAYTVATNPTASLVAPHNGDKALLVFLSEAIKGSFKDQKEISATLTGMETVRLQHKLTELQQELQADHYRRRDHMDAIGKLPASSLHS